MASESSPLLHLALEPQRPAPGEPHEFQVTATGWPAGERRVLGHSVGHGVPTTWTAWPTASTWTTGAGAI